MTCEKCKLCKRPIVWKVIDEWICIFCNIQNPNTENNDFISRVKYIEKLNEQHSLLLKHTKTLEKLMAIQKQNTLELEIKINKLKFNKTKYEFYRDKVELYESKLGDGITITELVEKLIKENKELKERLDNYDNLKYKYFDLISEHEKMMNVLDDLEESTGVYLNEIFTHEEHIKVLEEKIRVLIEEKNNSFWHKIIHKIRNTIMRIYK